MWENAGSAARPSRSPKQPAYIGNMNGTQATARIMVAIALAACAGLPAMAGEICWSRDSRHLAYVVDVGTSGYRGGWIWRTAPAPPAPGPWCIWVATPNGECTQIDESSEPLVVLAWHPDGHSLAALRLSRDETIRRWELVIYDAPGRSHVVYRLPRPAGNLAPNALAKIYGSWSPSGLRFALAVDDEVIVLSLPDGQPLARFSQAYAPAFSPQADVLAFYQRSPEGALVTASEPYDHPQFVLATECLVRPPVWTEDGAALMAIRARRLLDERGGKGLSDALNWQADVVRVTTLQGTIELLHRLTPDVREPSALPANTWFDLGADGQTLHVASAYDDQPTMLLMYDIRDEIYRRRWNPLLSAMPVDSLSLDPAGTKLALRFGRPRDAGAVVIVDLSNRERTLPAGDAVTRLAALSYLAKACEHVLPTPAADSPPWASRLPPPDAYHSLSQLALDRLDRLTAFAGPQLAVHREQVRRGETRLLDPQVLRGLDEADLYLSYLQHDWRHASAALARLDQQELSSEERLRQMTARIQLLLAMNRPRSALSVVEDVQQRLSLWRRQEIDAVRRQRLADIQATLDQLAKVARANVEQLVQVRR